MRDRVIHSLAIADDVQLPIAMRQPPEGIGDVGIRAGLNFLERALAQQIRGVDTIDIETEEAGLRDRAHGRRVGLRRYAATGVEDEPGGGGLERAEGEPRLRLDGDRLVRLDGGQAAAKLFAEADNMTLSLGALGCLLDAEKGEDALAAWRWEAVARRFVALLDAVARNRDS